MSGLAHVPDDASFKVYGFDLSQKRELDYRSRFTLKRPDCSVTTEVHAEGLEYVRLGTMTTAGMKLKLFLVKFGPLATDKAVNEYAKARILKALCEVDEPSRSATFPRHLESMLHCPADSKFCVSGGMMRKAMGELGSVLDRHFTIFAQAYDCKLLPGYKVRDLDSLNSLFSVLRGIFPIKFQVELDAGFELSLAGEGNNAKALLFDPVQFPA